MGAQNFTKCEYSHDISGIIVNILDNMSFI